MNPPIENPFPGLRPFEAEWSHLFFGRESQVDALLAALHRSRFLGVVGTSGSGKSSLVRAGLIPALRRGYLAAAGSEWREVIFRPGLDPLGELAQALAATASPHAAPEWRQADSVRHALDVSSFGLAEAIKASSADDATNCLIIVDQFEELFRSDASSAARSLEARVDFVQLLLTTVEQQAVPAHVVITMRSDYVGECARFRGLPEVLNRSQYLVPRMTRAELQDAIEAPIAVQGGTIAPRLVQRLLNDIGDAPDDLPLLQHVLMRLWEISADTRSKNGAIDLEHYADSRIGGLRSALNVHAEAVLAELTDAQRQMTRRIFQRLSEKTPANREVRRLASLRELADVAAPDLGTEAQRLAAVEAVLEQFTRTGRSFLTRTRQGDLDISHESLLRQWTRLLGWVDEEAASRDQFLRVDNAAQRWNKAKTNLFGQRRWGWLLRGPELAEALAWWRTQTPSRVWARRYEHAETPDDANDRFATVAGFLRLSRWRRFLLRGLAVGGAVATAFLMFVLWRMGREHEHDVVRQLLRESEKARASDGQQTTVSLLLAVEAFARSPEEARPFLQDAVRSRVFETGVLPSAAASAVLFSPDGGILCTRVSENNTDAVVLTRFPSNAQIARVEFDAPISAVAFSPDSRTLAVAGWDGRVHLISTSDGHEAPSLSIGGILHGVSYGRSGTLLAVTVESAQEDVDLHILSTANWATIRKVAHITAFALSPDERWLLIGRDRRGAELIDVKTGNLRARIPLEQVVSASFSPDGRMFATGSANGTVEIRKVETPEKPLLGEKHYNSVTKVEFSPGSRYLASASVDGEVIVRDLTMNQMRAIRHDAVVLSLAFSPDERELATGASARSRLMATATAEEWAKLDSGERVTSVFFHPSGEWLAIKAGDEIRILRVRSAAEPARTEAPTPSSDNALLTFGCQLAGRQLTPDERKAFLKGEQPIGCPGR